MRASPHTGIQQRVTPKKGNARPTKSCVAVYSCALCASHAVASGGGDATLPPLPLGDPQFWIVTLAALCAGFWILRKLLPAAFFSKRRKRAGKRATLTVGGKPVSAKPKRQCH